MLNSLLKESTKTRSNAGSIEELASFYKQLLYALGKRWASGKLNLAQVDRLLRSSADAMGVLKDFDQGPQFIIRYNHYANEQNFIHIKLLHETLGHSAHRYPAVLQLDAWKVEIDQRGYESDMEKIVSLNFARNDRSLFPDVMPNTLKNMIESLRMIISEINAMDESDPTGEKAFAYELSISEDESEDVNPYTYSASIPLRSPPGIK